MRLLLQRVLRAGVRVRGDERAIGRGIVALVGVGDGDEEGDARRLAEKAAHLRVFPDERGRFDKSLLDVGGSALVVSQFTLYGDCRKGRRPDFGAAMEPARAEPLYRAFVRELEALGVPCRTGEFGADMEVELVNDGPVTLWLDSRAP
ncbi:MAG TPA: D-aminoacyl-tRNA deacylase [Elusimicrobiota bacterium]|jgi:D-tyrosyl-tRNA(Tyr) deacylase|nr:D-aminoacyl-tRNA deacylase [Elusimicrobiota bacterium]